MFLISYFFTALTLFKAIRPNKGLLSIKLAIQLETPSTSVGLQL